MHAQIIGATGATGKDLLEILLRSEEYKQVDIFVRKDVNLQHQKLNAYLIDFDQPQQWQHLVQGDVLFSCLGTTLRTAGSQEAQWKVDYEYQFSFAKAAKVNKVPNYVLVSSDFAAPDAKFFYSRMKGQLEEAIKALSFDKTLIFNPPILVRKGSRRRGEIIGLQVIQFLNKLGLFKSQKPLPTEILAMAMKNSVHQFQEGCYHFKGEAIRQLAQ